MTKAVLTYSVFAAASVFFLVAAVVLAPLLAAWSVLAKRKTLPGVLQWFSTVDDDLDGGQHQHPEVFPPGATGRRLWWQRTRWIWRNPAQGFQIYLFGYDAIYAVETVKRQSGTPKQAPFMRLVEIDAWPDVTLFSYTRSIPIGGRRYIKVWFGWTKKVPPNRYSLKFVPFSLSSY